MSWSINLVQSSLSPHIPIHRMVCDSRFCLLFCVLPNSRCPDFLWVLTDHQLDGQKLAVNQRKNNPNVNQPGMLMCLYIHGHKRISPVRFFFLINSFGGGQRIYPLIVVDLGGGGYSFLVAVLLRCNSYTTPFTHLKYIIQRFIVHS